MQLEGVPISSTQGFDEAYRAYEQLRCLVNESNFEQAAERLRVMRDAEFGRSPFDSIILKLISGRISLRSGQEPLDSLLIDPDEVPEPFFMAELHLLRGYSFFNQAKYQEGAKDFCKAAEIYSGLELYQRSHTAEYNFIVGLENSEMLSSFQLLKRLKVLEKKAFTRQDIKNLGNTQRQISYIYADQGKWNRALEEVLSAKKYLLDSGAKADFDLAICQQALCLAMLSRVQEAGLALEEILSPIDSRVLFPRDFVKAEIEGLEINSQDYAVVSSYWRNRSKALSREASKQDGCELVWDKKYSLLYDRGENSKPLKAKSLEGRLIQLLTSNGQSKPVLCEQIWPEHCETEHLDNRLHRLVSRINQKWPGLIQFDGQNYSLGHKIIVKTSS